jgi:hypothetical protein
MANQTKFVSSIPNNTLEPVYLGGAPQTGPANSKGIFVPSCLRGETAEKSDKPIKVEKVPQFNEETFPSLIGGSIKTPKTFLGYANAVKKPAVNVEKLTCSAPSKNTPKTNVTPKYDDSDSDSYCDSDPYEEP